MRACGHGALRPRRKLTPRAGRGRARRRGRAHPGCVTWSPDGSRTPDGLPLVLAQAVVSAVDAVGGYAGGVYLGSRTPGLLRMAVLAGLPGPLLRPWWRMHVNRPFPVAEAYRANQPVYLGDAEDAMRRFPQLMAGLPFPFGSLYAPVPGATAPVGVLVVLRYATRGVPVGGADRQPAGRPSPRGSAPTSPHRRSRPCGTATPRSYGCPRAPRDRCASGTSSGTRPPDPSPRTTTRTRSWASGGPTRRGRWRR